MHRRMKLKPIAALTVLLLMVASLFVAGCTQTTQQTDTVNSILADQSSSNKLTSGVGKLAADNLAGAINDLYKEKNYTVNTPFTMTKNGDVITYHGVVTDGPQKLTPYKRNVTVVLVPDRAAARTTYRSAVDAQTAQGFQEDLSSNSSVVFWTGYLGTKYPSNNSIPKVRVDLNQPFYSGLILGGEYQEILFSADVSNYYQVLTDQQALVAT
jgi:hypothetical protein